MELQGLGGSKHPNSKASNSLTLRNSIYLNIYTRFYSLAKWHSTGHTHSFFRCPPCQDFRVPRHQAYLDPDL